MRNVCAGVYGRFKITICFPPLLRETRDHHYNVGVSTEEDGEDLFTSGLFADLQSLPVSLLSTWLPLPVGSRDTRHLLREKSN